MPYLASNQDVRENDTFKTVLMAGAALLGGAALGSMAAKSAPKAAAKGTQKGVAKGLYGDMAKSLDKDVVKNITMPEVSMNGPQMLFKEGKRGRAGSFKAKGGTRGERRAMKGQVQEMNQYVTDMHGKPEELGWVGQKVRDAKDKMFKRPTTTMANANEAGQYGGLSSSKLSIYEDFAKKSKASSYNVDSENLAKATDGVYNSAGNRTARRSEGVKNMVDDVELTNAIWDTPANDAKGAFQHAKEVGVPEYLQGVSDKSLRDTGRKFGTDDAVQRSGRSMRAADEIKDKMVNESMSGGDINSLHRRISRGADSNNDELLAARKNNLAERKKENWTSNAGKRPTGPGNANGLGAIDSSAIDQGNIYDPQQAKATAQARKIEQTKARLAEKQNAGRVNNVNKAERMARYEDKKRNAEFYEGTWGKNGTATRQSSYDSLFGRGGAQDQVAQKVRDDKKNMYEGLFGVGGTQDKATKTKETLNRARQQKMYNGLFGKGGKMDKEEPYKGLATRRKAEAKKATAAQALAEKTKPIKQGSPVSSSGAMGHFAERKNRVSQAVAQSSSKKAPVGNASRRQYESQF